MDKTKILTIVLAVFLLVSAVQAYQLVSLKGMIQEGAIPGPAYEDGNTDASGLPSNLNNLPKMQGGC